MELQTLFLAARKEVAPPHLEARIQHTKWLKRIKDERRRSFWRGFALAAGLAIVIGGAFWVGFQESSVTASTTLAQTTALSAPQELEDLEWFFNLENLY